MDGLTIKCLEKLSKYRSLMWSLFSRNINLFLSKTLFKSEKLFDQIKNLGFSTLLSKYKTWIKNKRSFKAYQLDINLEKLLQDKNLTSHNSWVRLFDETIASLNFPFKNKKLNSAEILNLLSDNKSK